MTSVFLQRQWRCWELGPRRKKGGARGVEGERGLWRETRAGGFDEGGGGGGAGRLFNSEMRETTAAGLDGGGGGGGAGRLFDSEMR